MIADSPRVAFIVNPVAGGGKANRSWSRLKKHIPCWISFEVHFSQAPGHAVNLSADIATENYDAVVAVGGDGTISEVVNGLLSVGMASERYIGPALGVIPAGRGNDLARTFSLSSEPLDAWRRQQSQLGQVQRYLDVGRVLNSSQEQLSYFVNMCGVGLDADVAEIANSLPRILGGFIPYLIGVVVSFMGMKYHKTTVRLSGVEEVPEMEPDAWGTIENSGDSEGQQTHIIEDALLLTTIGVGRFIGGGMMLLPHSVQGDGSLDVMLVRAKGRLFLLSLLTKSFKGEHLKHPDVAYFRARSVDVSGPDNVNVHADGDPITYGGAAFDVLPAILPVLF